MKRSELIFSVILLPIDYVLLVAAGAAAYFIRFSSLYQEHVREVVFALSLGEYLSIVWKVAILWVALFAVAGLYVIRPRGRAEEVAKVFLGCSSGIMAIVVYIFLQRELFASRFIVLAAWVLAIIFVSIGRMAVRSVQIRLLKRGIGMHRTVLVGSDVSSQRLADFLKARPEVGSKVVRVLPDAAEENFEEVKKMAQNHLIDEVIQAESGLPREQSLALVHLAHDFHIDFRYAADMFATQATNMAVSTLAGIPIVEVRRTKLDGWGKIIKRSFDILVAASGIVIGFPMYAVIGMAIKLDTSGPVIVRLQRIGARGRPFTMLKFRSMVAGAERMKAALRPYNERENGPLFKMADDPRVTRVGRFLRRTSIDELPQFWNVLKGDMSLVGPRPHEPDEVAQYQRRHKHLLDVRPGITGMAQVSGRSDLSFEDEVKLDVYYIENWSLSLDVKILLRTPIAVIGGRAAV